LLAPIRSKSLIFDIYGAFVRDLGGWIAVADLITLMGDLGVEEQPVRSSVSRMTRKGLLTRHELNGQAGYVLSPRAQEILAEGDSRIYLQQEIASVEDGWTLVTFSIPETMRAERHQLRSRLRWLGYGNVGAGLWIAPSRTYERTVEMVRSSGLDRYVDVFRATYAAFGDLDELVQRCWDLDQVRRAYRLYLAEFEPMAESWSTADPREEPRSAFRDYVSALHSWRKIPYLDPGLPPELLPSDWEGKIATDLFNDLRGRLEPSAGVHVATVMSAP